MALCVVFFLDTPDVVAKIGIWRCVWDLVDDLVWVRNMMEHCNYEFSFVKRF